MKILIVGSGGREHVLGWKIKQSPQCERLYCAPGNGGLAQIAECVDIKADDIEGLTVFARREKIDLTVVGPEVPLAKGIVDEFKRSNLRVFGPSKDAARLEGSKVFAKEFMQRWNIPTAAFETFETLEGARAFIEQSRFPLVVKADGLAAGKGVIVCEDRAQALEAVGQIMGEKVFKEAGERIVIEECLAGEEASILALSDGINYRVLASSQDHKRIFDEDMGPNTGGMGAYSPAPAVTEVMLRKIEARIIEPAIRGMAREGHPFKGVLYAGLMLTEQGPMALEFNVRFGDPEAQAVLPRLQNDLCDLLVACCDGGLHLCNLQWDPRSCVCVVMSSGGYPAAYEAGKEITGLAEADAPPDTMVFHAGTKKAGSRILSAGGRVLGVTALGDDIGKAIKNAYAAVDKIKFDHCFFRRDIGAKALGAAKQRTPASRGPEE